MFSCDVDEIKNFLNFLLDKVEDCYYSECSNAIDRFISDN